MCTQWILQFPWYSVLKLSYKKSGCGAKKVVHRCLKWHSQWKGRWYVAIERGTGIECSRDDAHQRRPAASMTWRLICGGAGQWGRPCSWAPTPRNCTPTPGGWRNSQLLDWHNSFTERCEAGTGLSTRSRKSQRDTPLSGHIVLFFFFSFQGVKQICRYWVHSLNCQSFVDHYD